MVSPTLHHCAALVKIFGEQACAPFVLARCCHGRFLRPRRVPGPPTWTVSPAKEAPKISVIMARPKRFELLTPRFVVWCSIGRVVDSRLIPEDGSPPRNETMRHEPDRHSPALDFERVDSTECAIRTLVVA